MSNQLPGNGGRSQGLARVLKALAGGAGVWRQKRRGSFLILVVGTLALLAVISILYVTIGTQDTRARAAADRREQIDEVPQKFADYVANQVIGPDALSVWFDDSSNTNSSGQVVMRRKTMTYPSIDWAATSSGSRQDARAFRVVPSADASSQILTTLDRFMPTTPWLASPTPTYLDYEGNGPTDAAGSPPRTYLDNRDWAQISNFAPDGRFVNLVNLRNNFTATHDQMTGVSGTNPPTLIDDRAMPTNTTDFRVVADPNYPAFFTSRQRGAFLPLGYRISGVGPGDPAFLTNQWADVDNDGYLDSRWMELVDPRDVQSGSAGDLLGVNTAGYRYFFAVRAIDLSGLVNVNTAGDSVSAPTGTAPWGISPADIDLRRLLTMQDSYDNYSNAAGSQPGGYDALSSKNPEADYSDRSGDRPYDRDQAFYAGVGGYTALRLSLASGSSVPRTIFDSGGAALYLASYTPNDRLVNTELFSIQAGLGNPISSNSMTLSITDTELAKAEVWNTWAPATGFTTSALLGAERRLDLYRKAAQAVDGVMRIDANNVEAQGRFGSDSLLELLTLHGLNDERALSPLEVALGGRNGSDPTNYPASGTPGSLRFSPLRSNRPFEDETIQYTTIDPAVGSVYDRTMLQVASDVRHLLTTVSGARQFRSVPVSDNRQISAQELKLDAAQAAAGGDIKTLFKGYADALALDSGRTSPMSAWTANSGTNVTEHHPLDTLFYGARGPETALHIAAHMAVNMRDGVDGDTTPSVYALVTCPTDAQSVAATERGLPLDQQVLDNETYGYDSTSGAAKSNNLSLDNSRLATAVSGQLNAGSITKIYGVEAQPFITEVASFTVYFDAPAGTPGSPQGDDEVNSSAPPDPNNPITIDGTTTSADCLYRVLAFQLTNPFDQDITLNEGGVIRGRLTSSSGPGAEQDLTQYYDFNPGSGNSVTPRLDLEKSFYYIKYGDNLFKLVAMDQPVYVNDADVAPTRANGLPALSAGPLVVGNYADNSDTGSAGPGSFGKERVTLSSITIPAGGSVVLCSLSRDLPTRIYNKVKDIGAAVPARIPNRPGALKNLVWKSIPGTASQSVYYIPRVDPATWQIKVGATNVNDNAVFTAGVSGSTPINLYRVVREGKDPTTGVDAGDAKHDFPRPVQPGSAAFWDGVTKADGTYTDPQTSYGQNNMENDQLVDRFIPDGTFNSNRKMDDGSQMVIGSMAGVDNTPSDGFTITYFSASVRPASGSGALAPGGIPGYCVQPKYVSNWNQSLTDGAPTANPSKAVFTATSFNGAAKTFEAFHTKNVTRSDTSKFARMLLPAEDRTSINQIGSGGALRPNAIPETASAAYSSNAPVVFSSGGGTSLTAVRSGLPSTSAGKPVVRLADLLLPLGVGPEFTPYRPGTTSRYDLTQPPEALVAWTTLSEALASAMGYEKADTYPAPAGMADPKHDSTFLFAPIDSGSGGLRLLFDRVTLRTDDFVPFIDADMDGQFTPGPSEYRVGLELPLALNVMDQFTTVPATQAVDRAVPGLININTAPIEVLRLIPGLAPLPYDSTIMDPTGRPYWWRAPADGYTGAQPPAGLVGNLTPGSVVDIASTIAAYRDKGPVWRRVGSGTASDPVVDYPESAPGFPRIDYNSNNTYRMLTGRTSRNLLGWTRPATGSAALGTGISELPGMRSIGEIMGARVWDPMNLATTQNLHYNIDFMAYDGTLPAGQLNSAIGFETGAPTDPSVYSTYKAKAKPVSSREKLALANVAFNSITTRSDYFAVWFMVQGYKKTDVTGLGANDPMIPSVRRQFVMVVDRSNVVKVGDKPRIVLFKEVPALDVIPAETN